MGDGDGDQRGGDRENSQHHAAMRGVDASAPPSAIRNGNAMLTHSIAIASCGHSRARRQRPAQHASSSRASTGRRSRCAARSARSDRSPTPRSASPAACRRRSPCRRSPATDRDVRATAWDGMTSGSMTWRDWLPVLPRAYSQLARCTWRPCAAQLGAMLLQTRPTPDRNNSAEHDIPEIPVAQRVIGPRAEPGAGERAGKAISASQITSLPDEAGGRLQAQAPRPAPSS